jgi:hypothetical protein
MKQLEVWVGAMNESNNQDNDDDKTKAAVAFAIDFVELGGVHAVVHFLDDAIFAEDNKCIQSALAVVVAFLDLTNKGGSPVSSALREAKEKVASLLIDQLSGIQLILRAVAPKAERTAQHQDQTPASPSPTDIAPVENAMVGRGDLPDGAANQHSPPRKQVALASTSIRSSLEDVWKSRNSAIVHSNSITPDLMLHQMNLATFSVAIDDLLIITATAVSGFEVVLDRALENLEQIEFDPATLFHDSTKTETAGRGETLLPTAKAATVAKTMEALAAVIPYGMTLDATTILDCVCREVAPNLTTMIGSSSGKHQQVAKLTTLKCILVAVRSLLDSHPPLLNKSDAYGATTVTATLMMQEPNNEKIIQTGCTILLIAAPKLTTVERKQAGIVTALGVVLASDALSDSIKNIADNALRELLMLDELRAPPSTHGKASPTNLEVNASLAEVALTSRQSSF